MVLWSSGSRGALLGLVFAVVVVAVQRRWFTREWFARTRHHPQSLNRVWLGARRRFSAQGVAECPVRRPTRPGTT